jgi:hypothetical protein
MRFARFSVEEAFRGVDGEQAEVFTELTGPECGYPFQRGERYLVYAHYLTPDRRLHTTVCTRTQPLSEAFEDLEFIRGAAAEDLSPGTISGVVRSVTRQPGGVIAVDAGVMAHVVLVFRSVGQRYEAMTDEEGRYEVADVPPGIYRVRVELPGLLKVRPARVVVRPGECRKVDVRAKLADAENT